MTLVEKELLGNFEGFRWSVVGVGVALLETVGDVIACVFAELYFYAMYQLCTKGRSYLVCHVQDILYFFRLSLRARIDIFQAAHFD